MSIAGVLHVSIGPASFRCLADWINQSSGLNLKAVGEFYDVQQAHVAFAPLYPAHIIPV